MPALFGAATVRRSNPRPSPLSSGQNKSKAIRETLKMGQFSHEWILPSRLADNPMVWILEINGLMMDIRSTPPD